MVRDFSRKLRLTGAVLGCATCKELASEFRRVNSRTTFDVERAYKWLQGRALPRQQQVYLDWLALLNIDRPFAWLIECDTEELLDLLCRSRNLPPDDIRRRAEAFAAGSSLAVNRRSVGGNHHICGLYVGYSFAWSPYYSGRVIRGALAVESPLAQGRLTASYTENLPTSHVDVRGSVTVSGRSLYMHLCEQGSKLPLFLSLYRPTPPASVLAGLICGATLVGHDPRPSVSRIVFLRVSASEGRALQASRYLEDGESLSADLSAAGLVLSAPKEVEESLNAFLRGTDGGGRDQVLADEYAGLVALFDRALIDQNSSSTP